MKQVKWALVAACATFWAASATQAGVLVSEKEVHREARVEWLSMKRHLPLDPDPRVQKYIECIANRLIAEIEPTRKQQFDWEVVVFDDEQVNASANPDGKIAVLSGLLKVADTPDSMAAVLGHEISHATLDHTMDRAKKGARTDMLVLLGSAAVGVDLSDIGTIGLVLPYAREQESQADLSGLTYMAKAGFDPRAAIYLWKNMSAANKNQPPEFLSTHPSDDARLDAIIKAITPALVEYNKAREAGKRPNCQAP
jgi:predicted Zn-dependent protease